jgi:hypothetical protein
VAVAERHVHRHREAAALHQPPHLEASPVNPGAEDRRARAVAALPRHDQRAIRGVLHDEAPKSETHHARIGGVRALHQTPERHLAIS